MKVLVLNCGSSSIKFQLLNMENESVLAAGGIDRIGFENSELTIKKNGERWDKEIHIDSHERGVSILLDELCDSEHGVLKSKDEIEAVGHRIVHGGESFSGSVIINQEVIDKVKECSDLAPLHNPANLQGIEAVTKVLPHVKQCGTFDTAFHQTMEKRAFLYAIPYSYYEEHKIRRYGFHGSSHKFVSETALQITGMEVKGSKIISCHLGNGASICAIADGKSQDTSMGLTPLEGLMMGTRSGNLDIGAVFYMMKKENLTCEQADAVLNKKSGILGLTESSSDMRDIREAAAKGDERAELVLQMYAYRVKKYIGTYAATLGGADIIIFTGGIGENDYTMRKRVCTGLEFMGVDFDEEKNEASYSDYAFISKPNSKVKVMSIRTNEELVIARDTVKLLQ